MKFRETLVGLILVLMVTVIHAQDYTLRFAGAGLASTIDSVRVFNLTRGNTVTISGSTALHLNGSGAFAGESVPGEIRFHPNPMFNYSLMEFESPDAGLTHITLYDLSGRMVAEISRQLPAGLHKFRITGTLGGVYLAKINSNGYTYNGKLVSANYGSEQVKIEYETSVPFPESNKIEKNTADLAAMEYHEGDVLKFTFLSGDHRATLVDIPAESKTLTANFIASINIDGDIYPIVQIGAQVWMALNLKTTHFNDGTDIPLITDPHQWAGTNSPAYSWRNNDEAAFRDPYGALYNWYAANSGKLCPSGWHVPDESDWTTLEQYMGGRNVAGGKLKEDGILHWNSPNTGANNTYEFSMIGGGYRDGQGGGFYELGRGGYLWSAIEEKPTDGRWRGFSNSKIQMDLGYSIKTTGMSIRCVMNDTPPDPGPGTISDYEGNVYKTIVIGKQTWMAENLRNTHLANGERIPELKTTSEWLAATTPAFSWRNNDEATYKVPYGALYNGYAMQSTSLCPQGYHIPLEKDVLALEVYLGGWAVIGGKLKEEGTQHWASPNAGASNSSGFTMLPGGYRAAEDPAGFYELGRGGYLWINPFFTADPGPLYLGFSKDFSHVDMGRNNLNTGFSVRCIKDDAETISTYVATNPVTNITTRTADITGTCIGVTVKARGFCWGRTLDLSTNGPHSEIWYNNILSGTGFSATMTGLIPNTTYYVKAYIIDPEGTKYGEVLTFKTLPDPDAKGTVQDVEGNVYNTIKIGNQTWMAENLKTTKYADGTPLIKGTRLSGANGKYYYVFDEDSTYKDTYGLLYSWFGAINSDNSAHYLKGGQGVCPSGWHIPDKDDKDELIGYLGGPAVAAGKLKESGFEHWISPNTDATNESGFTGRGAGIYTHLAEMLDGYGFASKDKFTAYWTSEIFQGNDFQYPERFGLNYLYNNVFSPIDIYCGASVRCLQDRPLTLQKDLVAWYPFNGNADDLSGKEHGGEVHGSTLTKDRFGQENKAYHFDGSSYIEVRDHPDFDFDPATSFSIACWIKLTNKEGEYVTVVQKGKQNATEYRISIGSGSDPGVIFTISKENSEAALYKPVTVSINDYTWHFVVALVNREEKSMKLYQDGDLLTEFTVDAARDFDLSTDATFKMGTGDYAYFFKGDLDDVRVYRRALQEAEIKELYHENGF